MKQILILTALLLAPLAALHASASYAVRGPETASHKDLGSISGLSLHYNWYGLVDPSQAAGQVDAQAVEEDLLGRIGFGHAAKPDRLARLAVLGLCRQHHVAAFDLGELLQKRPRGVSEAGPANPLWLRFRQTKPEQYRERILAVADLYLSSPVNLDFPLHPAIFGKVIYLMLGAHELTGDARYLDRARELARKAVEFFLSDGCPLPRATHKHKHYEAVTNGDSLMMSLLQLWASGQNPPRNLPLIYTDR